MQHQYNLGFNAFLSRYRAKFIRELTKGRKITSLIDVGCGQGDVIDELTKTSELIDQARKVTLVDFDNFYLTQVKKKFSKNPKFDFLLFDVERELKLKESYDLAVMIDIIEHLKNPVKVLKNIKGILSAGGKLVVITPNAKALHRRIGKEMGLIQSVYELEEADVKVGHVKLYDGNMLVEDTKKAGFKEIEVSGILLKPFPNSRMIDLEVDYIDALYEVGKDLPDFCGEIALVCR